MTMYPHRYGRHGQRQLADQCQLRRGCRRRMSICLTCPPKRQRGLAPNATSARIADVRLFDAGVCGQEVPPPWIGRCPPLRPSPFRLLVRVPGLAFLETGRALFGRGRCAALCHTTQVSSRMRATISPTGTTRPSVTSTSSTIPATPASTSNHLMAAFQRKNCCMAVG